MVPFWLGPIFLLGIILYFQKGTTLEPLGSKGVLGSLGRIAVQSSAAHPELSAPFDQGLSLK